MSHMQMGVQDPAASDLMDLASGTSENPESGSLPMLMASHAAVEFHVHGPSLRVDTQQSGPRGHDKFYSPNWGMFDAGHSSRAAAFNST